MEASTPAIGQFGGPIPLPQSWREIQGVTDSASQTDLLFLCHRVPFPPDKGDKIRSYRWLKALCSEYHVHLVAFVDDADDWVYQDRVQAICRTCRLFGLDRTWATLRSARGLATGSPLTLPYYQDRQVGLWLAELMRGYPIEPVFVTRRQWRTMCWAATGRGRGASLTSLTWIPTSGCSIRLVAVG